MPMRSLSPMIHIFFFLSWYRSTIWSLGIEVELPMVDFKVRKLLPSYRCRPLPVAIHMYPSLSCTTLSTELDERPLVTEKCLNEYCLDCWARDKCPAKRNKNDKSMIRIKQPGWNPKLINHLLKKRFSYTLANNSYSPLNNSCFYDGLKVKIGRFRFILWNFHFIHNRLYMTSSAMQFCAIIKP